MLGATCHFLLRNPIVTSSRMGSRTGDQGTSLKKRSGSQAAGKPFNFQGQHGSSRCSEVRKQTAVVRVSQGSACPDRRSHCPSESLTCSCSLQQGLGARTPKQGHLLQCPIREATWLQRNRSEVTNRKSVFKSSGPLG